MASNDDGVAESLRRLKAYSTGKPSDGAHRDILGDLTKVLGALDLKNIATMAQVGIDGATNKMVDDKTYLMERVVKVAAEMPVTSVVSQTLTNKFLSQLWTDLQHPPQSYLGDAYAYRTADGSNNNFLWPHIGAAGQPYARTVRAEHMQPAARPDPGLIYDSLLKRKKYEEHPNKISSVLFYLASIIIHDIFNTNHKDFNISNTSSYLDLAPLYGSSTEAQHSVRTMKDGKLKPDCFADARILGFPPGVGLLLIFFNRFHNDVVEKLAQIDENGRFSRILNPPGQAAPTDALQKYDEALFQTARLITSGLYINIILKDYVRTILNLNRVDSKWNLDPRAEEGRAFHGQKIPVATGNQVSAEFNLVYRWHSCVSARDTKWTEERAAKLFPVTSGKEPTMSEFLGALRAWGHSIPSDPFDRDFEGLQRDKQTGRFSDDDLATIWTESVEDVAGAYGANHVPEVLKMVEVLGITQARTWNLASLNEFRKYFHLEPHTTFESINPDPYVAEQLRRLYETPDNVELYPGIIVESVKRPEKPGSGLCTNFTTSRAILSDAVALVRGDRFYTVDYTPQNLTNFGYEVANYDDDIDFGGVFYKLVLNALPNHYSKNSIYVHYPLTVPRENKKIYTELNIDQYYDFSTPTKAASLSYIKSFEACRTLFQNAAKTTSLTAITFSSKVTGRQLSQVTGPNDAKALVTIRKHLAKTSEGVYVKQFFEKVTSNLMHKHTHNVANLRQVDIIRDVANLAQVHFAACMFALPLKTADNPKGTFTAPQLWGALTALYSSLHTVDDPADSFRAQIYARDAVQDLGQQVEENVRAAEPEKHGIIDKVLTMLHEQRSSDLTDQSVHLIQAMLETGITAQQLVYNYLLPVSAALVISQARAFADCIDFLLNRDELVKTIQVLAAKDTDAADTEIEHHVLETLRLSSTMNVHVLLSSNVKLNNGGQTMEVPANQKVICDTRAASHDSAAFKDADKYDPKRATDTYLPGIPTLPPMYPGQELGRSALVGMLKAILRLPNFRRAKGPTGRMKTIRRNDGTKLYTTLDERTAYLWPSSMKVNFG